MWPDVAESRTESHLIRQPISFSSPGSSGPVCFRSTQPTLRVLDVSIPRGERPAIHSCFRTASSRLIKNPVGSDLALAGTCSFILIREIGRTCRVRLLVPWLKLNRRYRMRPSAWGVAVLIIASTVDAQQTAAPTPAFTFEEVMIPMRDGVHLQTTILTPVDQKAALPILFRRTPYGVPDAPLSRVPTSWKELARDGYIFVIQNLRGRFKSEGVFKLSSQVNLADSASTNETTDAYDSIEWLVKHVRNNSGKVGMYGVSYDGLTTALALLKPHPALKAMSDQAAAVDQWMNDDMH